MKRFLLCPAVVVSTVAIAACGSKTPSVAPPAATPKQVMDSGPKTRQNSGFAGVANRVCAHDKGVRQLYSNSGDLDEADVVCMDGKVLNIVDDGSRDGVGR